MPSKKDNLPLNVEKDMENTGTITYANEVIAIIAGVATSEVEGIAGMVTSGGISDILGRYRNITKGVKVELGSEETSVDLFVIVEYGTPIQKAARDAQENVRKAIETMTGLHVVKVDVHVQGVSFEKENKALEKGQQSAALASGEVFTKVTGQNAPAQEDAPVPPAVVELVEDEDDALEQEEKEEEERGVSEPEDQPASSEAEPELSADEPKAPEADAEVPGEELPKEPETEEPNEEK